MFQEKKDLVYIDDKGNKLFGYSQVSLDKNTFWTRIVAIVLAGILIYILWITWYVIHNNVVNNVVARCL